MAARKPSRRRRAGAVAAAPRSTSLLRTHTEREEWSGVRGELASCARESVCVYRSGSSPLRAAEKRGGDIPRFWVVERGMGGGRRWGEGYDD